MCALRSLDKSLWVRNLPSRYFRFFSSSSDSDARRATYAPNRMEKYLLVWIKKYPSVKDVPDRVTPDEMERVRNWARIKINIAAVVATIFGCIYMIKLGKDAVKRGESVKQMNIDWHKAQNEKKHGEQEHLMILDMITKSGIGSISISEVIRE